MEHLLRKGAICEQRQLKMEPLWDASNEVTGPSPLELTSHHHVPQMSDVQLQDLTSALLVSVLL